LRSRPKKGHDDMNNDTLPDKLCARCLDEADSLYPATDCPDPRIVTGPIGMHHCGGCGTMVLAGSEHPSLCRPCLTRTHPLLDGLPDEALDDGINYPGSQWELRWIVACSVASIVLLSGLLAVSYWGWPW
jgi:hypothetical protein